MKRSISYDDGIFNNVKNDEMNNLKQDMQIGRCTS